MDEGIFLTGTEGDFENRSGKQPNRFTGPTAPWLKGGLEGAGGAEEAGGPGATSKVTVAISSSTRLSVFVFAAAETWEDRREEEDGFEEPSDAVSAVDNCSNANWKSGDK